MSVMVCDGLAVGVLLNIQLRVICTSTVPCYYFYNAFARDGFMVCLCAA